MPRDGGCFCLEAGETVFEVAQNYVTGYDAARCQVGVAFSEGFEPTRGREDRCVIHDRMINDDEADFQR